MVHRNVRTSTHPYLLHIRSFHAKKTLGVQGYVYFFQLSTCMHGGLLQLASRGVTPHPHPLTAIYPTKGSTYPCERGTCRMLGSRDIGPQLVSTWGVCILFVTYCTLLSSSIIVKRSPVDRSNLLRNCKAAEGSWDVMKHGVGNIRSVSFKSWIDLLEFSCLTSKSGFTCYLKLFRITRPQWFLDGSFPYFLSQPAKVYP